MRYALSECVETKTVTTTTTTKRTYPPVHVRPARPLQTLDHKEYPLAHRATPKELTHITWDAARLTERNKAVFTAPRSQTQNQLQEPDESNLTEFALEDSSKVKAEPTSDMTPADSPTRSVRKPMSIRDRLPRRHARPTLNLSHAITERLCRTGRPASLGLTNANAFPATPDTTDMSLGQALGEVDLEAFSPDVPTPPVDKFEDGPYPEAEAESSQEDALVPRARLSTVAAQSDTLPSPGASPTLAATQMTTDLVPWEGGQSGTLAGSYPDVEGMLQDFDSMPSQMQSFMIYQMLRRCNRKTLHMVANVVNPALKCDFLKELPNELSLMILGYLDHHDLCSAAQVSKYWRNIVDTNETGWKDLLDRDNLDLPDGELEMAILQGWGWQDPVGYYSGEKDLSQKVNTVIPESLLKKSGPSTRSSTRKRAMPAAYSDRSKRRASGQEKPGSPSCIKSLSPASELLRARKSDGPIAHATAAALAVPDPGLGLPSLRKLHLYKSLYRRRHMIRSSWTNPNFKPYHVAFTAHPRHVITCLQFDEDKIITGSDDTFIQVYDTKTGELRKKLSGHEGGVWALHYVGNTLVSGSTDRSVRVWDIERGLCTHIFWGHTSTVRCLQILMPTEVEENGQRNIYPKVPLIITGSRDSQLRVWKLPASRDPKYMPHLPPSSENDCPYLIRSLVGHSHSVRAIAAHGDILVSGSYDMMVKVWRISTGENLHTLQGHTQKVYSVVLDLKRNRCISGSMDSNVRIWDLTSGQCLHVLEGHTLLVGLLDLKQERLVSAAADGTLRIWDPDNGRCKQILTAHTGAITCFQHDSRKVISGSEKSVKIWDIATGECVQNLLSDLTGVWQVAFDRRRCVAAVQRNGITYLEVCILLLFPVFL